MAEIIVVHGPPGSGKTTQCARLAEQGFNGTHVQHVSAGNTLRAIKQGTIDSEFSQYLLSPEVTSPPPDKVMHGIVFEAMAKDKNAKMILIDSFPNVGALPDFQRRLEEAKHHLAGAVFFDIDLLATQERLMSRPSRIGEDVLPETRESSVTFHYYRELNTNRMLELKLNFHGTSTEHIDAMGDQETVLARLETAIGHLAVFDLERENVIV